MEISGSKAIIVGGASGMALATAEAFVAKGGTVAILDLEKSKGAEQAARLKGTFHPCNVMDYEGTEKVIGEAVKALGKSDVGQKTMLDVLAPVLEALKGDARDLPGRLRAAATAAAEATIPLRAIRGRASFLGERSIGHMDPGARSAALMVEAIADVMEERP